MTWRQHTCVFVFGLVHLAIRSFSNDADDVKLIHAAFSPVALSLLSLSKPRTANPGVISHKQHMFGLLFMHDEVFSL